MIKLKAILKGWENYIFTDPEIEVKAKERAKICAGCPMSKKGTYPQLMKDYTLKNVEGMVCGVCGCPLSTLLRQDEKKCELNKWE
jgi:hypothetical protein